MSSAPKHNPRSSKEAQAGTEIDRPSIEDLDPDLVARIVLTSLPKLGPARSRWLVADRSAPDAVAALAAGSFAPRSPAPRGVSDVLLATWGQAIRDSNLARLVAAQFNEGAYVIGPEHRLWPFADDPEPPLVLFCRGDARLMAGQHHVAIVGTRRCTSVGRRVAYQFGFDLASEGVSVVSGLALGVDAAAHHGCLDAGGRPVAVVASGVDVVYPKVNASLWSDVIAGGLIVSEAPAGTHPQRWRFPARNRLIAALGHGTVIVESHHTGGALITAEEAADRGKPVMAVPGSVLSPSAEGCNNLLVDGATPVRDVDDVLDCVGLSALAAKPHGLGQSTGSVHDRRLDRLGALVMAELANGPATIDVLIAATEATAQEVVSCLSALVGEDRASFDGVTASLP